MASPTGSDGIERAISLFLVPPVTVFIVISVVNEFYGGAVAGVVYLVLTAGIFAGILLSAKYWNVPYTASFVLAGIILWLMVPDVVSELIHPVFGALGTLIGAVFFILMLLLLVKKSGLDKLI